MTSACSTRLRQRVCPPTRLPDAIVGAAHAGDGAPGQCAVTSTELAREMGHSRASPDAPVQGDPLRHPEPVTSQATMAPGSRSRRQTFSDGPVTSISADPTRRNLAGPTHYPSHGDGQRPNPDLLLTMPSGSV